MITSRLAWNGTSAEKVVLNGGKEVIQRATVFLWTSIQTALNTPNSGVRVRGKKGQKGFTYYPNPSSPGQPPHKITGHGAGAVRYEFSADGLSSRVGLDATAPYMAWLEFGVTGGKTIRPKTAKALRWVGKDGAIRFARSVRQGAIKARPWLFGTLKKILPQLRALSEQ